MARPEELSAVALTRDLPEFRLKSGDVGVVVHVYPKEAVEVEFMDSNGDTVALLTILDVDLRHPSKEERANNNIPPLPEGMEAPIGDATKSHYAVN